jgi:hypothetical protein
MDKNITDFISAAVSERPVQAIKAFSAALEPKIQAAMADKKIEVTKTVFNQPEENKEDE